MQETIAQGTTWQGEVTNRRKDGSTYEAALTITPVLSPTGTVINYVSVYHDISALKEIDRLKSRFVSDVSHELRTPLTNIRLYLDLIARVKDRGKTERYLKTLSRESDRLANLIDDLLSLSRIDVGTTQLYRRPMNVNDLLRSLAEDRRSLAAKQGLQLEIITASDLPEILGDERLLSQVFTNLLTNAMNYTQEGGEITLRTRSESEASMDWIIVEVEDSGLGIPLDEQSEIFTRFFRGAASKSTGAPGTGLGLAICDEIIHRHGGHITVSSEGKPGKGSCFSVWLPVDLETSQD
jgi:two-component system phosphate regulon sensor histidine kinase PhoR